MDYAVVNETLTNNVQSFQVLDPNTGSDHSAIQLNLSIQNIPKTARNNDKKLQPRIKWNDETKMKFQIKMSSPNTFFKINELQNKLDLDADNTVPVITDLIKLLTPEEHGKKNKGIKKKTAPKKWYDHTCYEMSQRLKNVTKLFVKSPTNPNLRGSYCKTRKEYRKLLKMKKQEWKKEMISKLETLEKEKPKEYWKIVNELREKRHKETSFNTTTFIQFFQNLYAKTELNNTTDKEIEKFVSETLENLESSGKPDFTLEELINAIKRLKNNKATGPDRIPAEILKHALHTFLSFC